MAIDGEDEKTGTGTAAMWLGAVACGPLRRVICGETNASIRPGGAPQLTCCPPADYSDSPPAGCAGTEASRLLLGAARNCARPTGGAFPGALSTLIRKHRQAHGRSDPGRVRVVACPVRLSLAGLPPSSGHRTIGVTLKMTSLSDPVLTPSFPMPADTGHQAGECKAATRLQARVPPDEESSQDQRP